MAQGRKLLDGMLLSSCCCLVIAREHMFSEASSPMGLGRYKPAQIALKDLVLE